MLWKKFLNSKTYELISVSIFRLMFLDWKRKLVYFNGRSYNTHQRSQRISSTKKIKLFNQIPLSTSDGGFQCKDIFNSLDYRSNGDNHCGDENTDDFQFFCFVFSMFLFRFRLWEYVQFWQNNVSFCIQ